jgi:hypothetical protein
VPGIISQSGHLLNTVAKYHQEYPASAAKKELLQ